MIDQVSFTVRGRPVPQGGLTAYNRGSRAVLTHKRRPELEAWRDAIATEARTAVDDRVLMTGPVEVLIRFWLPRPRRHYLPANARRPEPVLRLDAPAYVDTMPDIDKLGRAVLDALSGVVFGDDCQVARLLVDKRYADGVTGARVTIRPMAVTR
jgi:crossover junction endodeoxyribonuclease RusA